MFACLLLTCHSPKTLELSRAPKYPRKSVPHAPRMDASTVLIHPLNTESAMKKVRQTLEVIQLRG
jgi:large subunit ribosomal protein L23Ae